MQVPEGGKTPSLVVYLKQTETCYCIKICVALVFEDKHARKFVCDHFCAKAVAVSFEFEKNCFHAFGNIRNESATGVVIETVLKILFALS